MRKYLRFGLFAFAISLFILVFKMAPFSANAATQISYIYYDNGTYKNGSRTDYSIVNNTNITSSNYVTGGWWYVDSNVSFSPMLFADVASSSTLNIIVKDGCTLTLNDQENGSFMGNNINIYGQSRNYSSQGKIEVINALPAFNNYGDLNFHCVNLKFTDCARAILQSNDPNNSLRKSNVSFYGCKVETDDSNSSGSSAQFTMDAGDLIFIDSDLSCNHINGGNYDTIVLRQGSLIIDNSTVNLVGAGDDSSYQRNINITLGNITIRNGSDVKLSKCRSTVTITASSSKLTIDNSRCEFSSNGNGYALSESLTIETLNGVVPFGKMLVSDPWTELRIESPYNERKPYMLFAQGVPEVTISDVTLTYNGSAQTPTVTPSITSYKDQNITFKYKLNTASSYGDMPTFTEIGGPTTVYFEASIEGYVPYEGTFSVTVDKPEITDVSFAIINDNITYTGENITPLVTPSYTTIGNTPAEFTYSLTEDGTYSSTVPSFKDAGAHTIYYKAVAQNHKDKAGSFTFNISEATITNITVSDFEATYTNGNPITVNASFEATTVGNQTPAIIYSSSADGTYNASYTLLTPGVHTVYYKITAPNHETSEYGTLTATINNGILDEELSLDAITFSGSTPTITFSDLLAKDGTVNTKAPDNSNLEYTFSLEENGTYTSSIPQPTSKNVGKYTVYYKINAQSGYYDETTGSFEVEIVPYVVVINWGTDEFIYDGTNQEEYINPTWQDLGSTTYEFDIELNKEPFVNADLYLVTVSFKENDVDTNYVLPEVITHNYRIIGDNPTLEDAPTMVSDLVFTGSELTLANPGNALNGTILYSIDNTNWSAELPKVTNAGNYTVYYMIQGDLNYEDLANDNWHFDVTVSKKEIDDAILFIENKNTKKFTYTGLNLIDDNFKICFMYNDVTYYLNCTGIYEDKTDGSEYQSFKEIGKYKLAVDFKNQDKDNFEFDTANPYIHLEIIGVTLTVKPADLDTIKFLAEKPTDNYEIVGWLSNDDKVAFETLVRNYIIYIYYYNDSFNLNYRVGAPAGVYEVCMENEAYTLDSCPTGYEDFVKRYNPLFEIETGHTLEVVKEVISLSDLEISEVTYDMQDHLSEINAHYSLSYLDLVDDLHEYEFDLTLEPIGFTKMINASSYEFSIDIPNIIIDGTLLKDAFMLDANFNKITVKVLKKDATISVIEVPSINKGDSLPKIKVEVTGLINEEYDALNSLIQENISPIFENIDTNIPGKYDFDINLADSLQIGNYNISLVSNIKLVICDKLTSDIVTAMDLDPIHKYELEVTEETPLNESGEPYKNLNDEVISVKVLIKDDETPVEYTGLAKLIIDIPETIDPDYFDLFKVLNDSPILINKTSYEVDKENRKVIITDSLPAKYVFNNTKGQIFVTINDITINDGDNIPSYSYTITGYMGGDNNNDLTAEIKNNVKVLLKATTNYTSGKTGSFNITVGFAKGKDEYSLDGFRIHLGETGTLIVKPKVITDEGVSVTNSDGDSFDINITLQVEVKSELNQEEVKDYSTIGKGYIKKNEKVISVYDVKLMRKTTVNGKEELEEIQPEDIKPGTTIVIKMSIPEELKGKKFKVLHIHATTDMEFVDYEVNEDYILITTNRLSQFAFVVQKPNQYAHSGWCIGWIAFILDMLVAIYFVVYLFVLKKELYSLIGISVAGATFLNGLIILCTHPCVVSTISFILSIIVLGLFIFIYLKNRDKEEENKE